ncbi:MAG TPA: T9SS type A sorting domain-containing protein [Ferruginibacter sp.]|nr:T9SS type A sorting domain-containing protein [Ferruginibacter sp.]
MKKITLLLGMLAITFIAFSQDPRCPVIFKRNNGNAGGCDARITFYYNSCPPTNYVVAAILNNGVDIPGLTFTSTPCINGQVDVCVTGGNIPPAGLLSVRFCIPNSNVCWLCFVPEGGPQPVKLSGFVAKRNKGTVQLIWKSETEINSKEYVVQRKTGNDWVDVATIPSVNSAIGGSYSYTDNNPTKSISQYRLKMVDFDAAFTNSDIRPVKGNGAAADFTIFPNPSSGNATVSITDISEPTDVQLIDNSGRVLKNVSLTNTSTVELNNLQKGMYMIRITNKTSGESLTKKLTVAN